MFDAVELHGHHIEKGSTTADDLFAMIHKDEETGEAKTSPDVLHPESLEVSHDYLVDCKHYTFWLSRKESSGPYYVDGIAITDY